MQKHHSKTVETLLARMTLDEKIAQLGSTWFYELQTEGQLDPHKLAGKLGHGIGQITRVAGASRLDPRAAAQAANTIQKYLVENTRLGIPAILHEECCSGAMALGGSVFPQIIGLAATFQPELAEAMTGAIRQQLRAIGASQGLAPVLDVGRDPRWGRIEETFGEDPILVSQFGMAYVRGLQGELLAEGVLATGKHFIGHSLSQGGLNCGPVQIGRRELYEVYLAPFQAAIREAGLGAIMNAYPELDGEVVAASRKILTELLRDELGFEGVVVSDYEAIAMLHNYHFVAADRSEAARLSLNAGIDVELPTTTCYGEALKAALESGDLALEAVDTAVRRHLQKKVELGLFDQPYVDASRALEVFETPENRTLAHQIACQSLVLLKNDGLLPLKKTLGSLAVIGPNAAAGRNQLGDYAYAATVELLEAQAVPDSSFKDANRPPASDHQIQIITVLEGIKAIVSSDTRIVYARGCDNLANDRSGFEQAVQAARQAEAVALVLGDRSGLTPGCTSGETRDSMSLQLPGVQGELAEAILATGKPVVVVLINGRPFAIPELDRRANAILEAWLPGEEGGRAVAEALFGEYNPGGKLPITVPRSAGQTPVYYNHKPSGMRSNWYGDYFDGEVSPLYPFGHGLSYTEFHYTDLEINPPRAGAGERVDITFAVTNAGSVPGDEVAQVYIRDEIASLPRPVQELKAFRRIHLQPGETRRLTCHLPVEQLAFLDASFALVVEPGRFAVMIGSSCDDIRLQGSFEATERVEVPLRQRVFVCPVEVDPE